MAVHYTKSSDTRDSFDGDGGKSSRGTVVIESSSVNLIPPFRRESNEETNSKFKLFLILANFVVCLALTGFVIYSHFEIKGLRNELESLKDDNVRIQGDLTKKEVEINKIWMQLIPTNNTQKIHQHHLQIQNLQNKIEQYSTVQNNGVIENEDLKSSFANLETKFVDLNVTVQSLFETSKELKNNITKINNDTKEKLNREIQIGESTISQLVVTEKGN